MKHSINDMVGFAIGGSDGEFGKVSEFYFDDYSWSIRYLIVETGNWLMGKKVLIPHASLGQVDWDSKKFHVNLTMDQISKSPDIDTDKPVSHQNEVDLFNYYILPFYWEDNFLSTPPGIVPILPIFENDAVKRINEAKNSSDNDPHLRSTKEVKGYNIQAKDGEIGNIEDYLVDDEKWKIYYLRIDTQKWLPGKKVLMPAKCIDRIELEDSKIYVNLSLEVIKNSPEYNPSELLDYAYEKELVEYYIEKMSYEEKLKLKSKS